nr:MAG TPA: hypothetical protein [Caudoviricetes sp.]
MNREEIIEKLERKVESQLALANSMTNGGYYAVAADYFDKLCVTAYCLAALKKLDDQEAAEAPAGGDT